MPEGHAPEASNLSRRDILTKGAKLSAGVALVGWTRPEISSLVLSQAETTPQANGESNISYIALMLNCGGTLYRVKFEENKKGTGEFDEVECGPTFKTPGCRDFHTGEGAEGCPSGVTADPNEDGTMTINLGNCIVQDYMVKCGQCCYGPGQQGGPGTPATGTITFQQCPANQPPC